MVQIINSGIGQNANKHAACDASRLGVDAKWEEEMETEIFYITEQYFVLL